MTAFYIGLFAYMLSVLIVFAGMILTPTKSSRKADQHARERQRIHGLDAEINYLSAKLYVAIFWPWFFITSFFNK